MQRLDAQTIACQQQAPALFIENRKGKHASQLMDAIGAVFLIEMYNHFGIGVGIKMMTFAFKLRTQFGEVVNLSVEDNPDRLILVLNRLAAASHVNNAQSPHSTADWPSHVKSLIIRPWIDCGSMAALASEFMIPAIPHIKNSHQGYHSWNDDILNKALYPVSVLAIIAPQKGTHRAKNAQCRVSCFQPGPCHLKFKESLAKILQIAKPLRACRSKPPALKIRQALIHLFPAAAPQLIAGKT